MCPFLGAQVLSSQQKSTGEASKSNTKDLLFLQYFPYNLIVCFHPCTEQKQSEDSPESTLLKVRHILLITFKYLNLQ